MFRLCLRQVKALCQVKDLVIQVFFELKINGFVARNPFDAVDTSNTLFKILVE